MRRRLRRRLVAATAATVTTVALTASCVGGGSGRSLDLDELVISGGGTTGIYYGYGGALADVVTERTEVPSAVLESGGSIENLDRIAAGDAQFGFSTADAAGDAVSGADPFDRPLPVQAIARVYDDFVHVIVPADSPISSVQDLRGHRVSLGADGSGTEVIARRVLSASGVAIDSIIPHQFGINASIDALRTGQIDAFFWSGGLPTPGIDDLARDMQIRLIDLWDVVEPLRTSYGSGYRHGVVPQGTYGMTDDVATLAVPNYLMVHADIPNEVVIEVLTGLFDERSEITMSVPAAALLDRSRAIYTEPVDLHPGALEYFRDSKL